MNKHCKHSQIEEIKLNHRNIFSKGNKKLPKTTAIFNITPVKSCPGKTPLCENLCYALKAQSFYRHTREARKRNYLLSFDNDFVSIASQHLSRLRNVEQVRVHESGDFYNQEYLNKWYSIAKRFPDLIFYAYTKSWFLDFSDKPKNFILIQSYDDSTLVMTTQIKNLAYMKTGEASPNYGKWTICPADCRMCDVCFNPKIRKRNVIFNKH